MRCARTGRPRGCLRAPGIPGGRPVEVPAASRGEPSPPPRPSGRTSRRPGSAPRQPSEQGTVVGLRRSQHHWLSGRGRAKGRAALPPSPGSSSPALRPTGSSRRPSSSARVHSHSTASLLGMYHLPTRSPRRSALSPQKPPRRVSMTPWPIGLQSASASRWGSPAGTRTHHSIEIPYRQPMSGLVRGRGGHQGPPLVPDTTTCGHRATSRSAQRTRRRTRMHRRRRRRRR